MTHEAGRQHYNVTFALLALAAIAYALMQSLVAPALPILQRLGRDPDRRQQGFTAAFGACARAERRRRLRGPRPRRVEAAPAFETT